MDVIIAPSIESNLIFFHGFLGHQSDWEIIFDGLRDSFPSLYAYPLSSFQENFQEIISYKNAVYIGYSMGGRAATVAALANPCCQGLFLESTSLGIENERERQLRAEDDQLLFERIRRLESKEEIRIFLEDWYALPLFRGIKDGPFYSAMLDKRVETFSKEKIKIELEKWGVGHISPLTSSLKNATFSIFYIAGQWDEKYKTYGKELCQRFPHVGSRVIEEASHNIHFTHPYRYIEILQKFLQTLPVVSHEV